MTRLNPYLLIVLVFVLPSFCMGASATNDRYADSLIDAGNYAEYLNWGFKEYDKYKNTGECRPKSNASFNIGRAYYYLRNDKKSREWFHVTLGIARKCKDNKQIGITLRNLGSIWLDYQNPDSAAWYYDKALPYLEKDSDKLQLSTFFAVGFELWFRHKKDNRKALYYLNKALETAYLSKDTGRICFAEVKQAIYFMETNQCKKADSVYKMVYRLIEPMQEAEFKLYILSGMLSNYIHCGDVKNALATQSNWYLLRDSIFNAKSAKAAAEYEVLFDTKEKELENTKLRQRNTQLIWIGLILFLLIGGGGFYLTQRRQWIMKREFEEKLREEQRLRFAEVLSAQEQEQTRIAGDLHDSLGHLLSAAKLNLSVMEASNDQQKELLETLNKIIDEAGTEARNLAHRIMPQSLSELGLTESLRELTNRISKTGKIQVLFQVDKVDESLLSQGKKIALYRICQELLNNMIKHSQATEIQITLRFKDDAVELIIQDNGQGFDVNEINKSEGLGWRNNRSRVEILNGYFKIESSKGLGTSITVKIPNHD